MAIIYDEKIEKIVPQESLDLSEYEVIDAKGKWVAPGLVDIHIHGYMGADTCDGDPDGIRKMSAGLAKNGVTSFCPTTMTVSVEEIEKAFNDAREVKAEGAKNGAKVVGVNCEGPSSTLPRRVLRQRSISSVLTASLSRSTLTS